MTAHDIPAYMAQVGVRARAASTDMARASTLARNAALTELARMLRADVSPLEAANAKDIAAAEAAGLAPPMVDRLRLNEKILETLAQGCEQLAAMPDPVGEITGVKRRPSGIAVGLATEIPSHNLREIADACVALIKTPSLSQDELLAIVAIESHRHRCMVVGEDLGTVEDAVRTRLEGHLFDYAQSCYGKNVRVEFLEKIRDEEKFIDLPTLTAAIDRDAELARAWFARRTSSGAVNATDRI
eukprot:gene46606-62332_t